MTEPQGTQLHFPHLALRSPRGGLSPLSAASTLFWAIQTHGVVSHVLRDKRKFCGVFLLTHHTRPSLLPLSHLCRAEGTSTRLSPSWLCWDCTHSHLLPPDPRSMQGSYLCPSHLQTGPAGGRGKGPFLGAHLSTWHPGTHHALHPGCLAPAEVGGYPVRCEKNYL